MKKMYLVLVAVVMAVSFSAFTTIKKAPDGDFRYHDGTGMVPVPPEITVEDYCPQFTTTNDCVIEIDNEDELIYLNGLVYKWGL